MNTNTMDRAKKLLEPPQSKLPRYMVLGTEARRGAYTAYKRALNRKAFTLRERLVREHAHEAGFTIPRDQGFKVFAPGAFAEEDEIVRGAQEHIASIDVEALNTSQKSQLKQGLLPKESVNLESAYFRFALRPDILASVSTYLGVVPVLTAVDIWYSTNQGQGKKLGNSQLYHCDWADVSQVKIFFYATETDTASGPLVVMGANTSKILRDKAKYQFGVNSKLTDEQVHALVGDKDQHPLTGPAGTCTFVDTSRCFHYGSRVLEGAKPRTLALFQYSTPSAFSLPVDYREAAPYSHLATPQVSLLQRLVLGAE